MDSAESKPKVTIGVVTFGDYPALIERLIESIRCFCQRSDYALVVGANAVSDETLRFLKQREDNREIDRLIVSPRNLNKCPMMKRIFEHVQTDYIWMFDDDTYIAEPNTLERWIEIAKASPESTVLWGRECFCECPPPFKHQDGLIGFVRSASWYRGLPPPSWRPGGKGEFNYMGLGMGNGHWEFVSGGCFMIRTSAVRALDWPDARLLINNEDILLGEAVRQQGWAFANVEPFGVVFGPEPSRGERI